MDPITMMAVLGGGAGASIGGGLLSLKGARKSVGAQQKEAKKFRRFLQNEYNKANSVNEARLNEALSLSDQIGESGKRDLTSSYSDLAAQIRAQTSAQGLGGTSVGSVMQRRVGMDRVDALQRLREQNAARRMSLLSERQRGLDPSAGYQAVLNVGQKPGYEGFYGSTLSNIGNMALNVGTGGMMNGMMAGGGGGGAGPAAPAAGGGGAGGGIPASGSQFSPSPYVLS
jgi:hypothetical protein